MIAKHLTSLVEDLERKLANPKNTWKRREELQAEIADAQKRLDAVSGRNRKRGTTSDGLRQVGNYRQPSSRTAQRRSRTMPGDSPQKTARALPRLLEVNYR